MGRELVIPLVIISSIIAISVSGHQFEVGWAPPSGNESETYNEWAGHHRFHIGDSIYFKYQDDSVVLVNQEGYESCNGSSPIEEFGEDGAKLEFDRHGFFYFISGDQGNCESGQRIIVRVMVQNAYHRTSFAPGPSPVGSIASHSGSASFNEARMVFMGFVVFPILVVSW